MRIVICSSGRPGRQITWQQLPKKIQDQTCIVVQKREAELYLAQGFPVIVLPEHITTIGPTREWVVKGALKKVIMLDDDLVFATRRTDDPTKFVPATGSDIEYMFEAIACQLDLYAHVGLAPREGGNRNTSTVVSNTRMMRVLGYRADVLRKECIRFDRVPVMEDFDVTLQLLRKGYPNVLWNKWVHNQGGSNTEGGCSAYRTDEIQEQAAHELARLHKPYVTVVKKQTKTAWGGKERTDVRIQWKAAFGEYCGPVRVLDRREGEDTN